jgi:isoleucyl-tRNA synthetase
VPKVAACLAGIDGKQVQERLEADSRYVMEIEGEEIVLDGEDIILETELPENIASSDFSGGNVFVDTEITPQIRSEAMSRELVRRIQDMRKDLDLDVEANIEVYVDCGENFRELVEPFLEFICNEVRAQKILFQSLEGEYSKEWNIEDEKMTLSILKSENKKG